MYGLLMKKSTTDKVEGKLQQAKGSAKEIIGNPKLEVRGKVEKTAGKVQSKVGDVKKVFGK